MFPQCHLRCCKKWSQIVNVNNMFRALVCSVLLLALSSLLFAIYWPVYNPVSNGLPNIVFILADDLGWNDIGYHNPDIKSPNIDQLSDNGIRLNSSYMQYLCSPSRAAVLTGYYPFRTGMQHGVVWRHSGNALPLRFELLPRRLENAGYASHLIGKWHLGHCHQDYLPTSRGFRTSYGPFAGGLEYFSHKLEGENIVDFFNGTTPVLDKFGIHSSTLYLEQLDHVLTTSSTSNQPIFLFLPFNLPHFPLQIEEKYLNLYPRTTVNEKRRKLSAMVSALDDNVGSIVEALKRHKMYKNTVIIFTSDNGGQISAGGSNFPLKGNKNTLYEGGTRVVGFIHSPLLKSAGFTYNGLIHAVDWFSTILRIANIETGEHATGELILNHSVTCL